MGWGRIDDRFDDHQKVIDLLEYEHGAAAIGLWTLCFTWAHRNTRKPGKTPGLIPASLPRRYVGPTGRELAALLVKVDLWEVRGDDGWQFHDFDQYLPTEQTRDARSEAGKKGAQARWGKRAGRDGKLPSDDGKPMAADSSRDAPGSGQDANSASRRQRSSAHGNEPSGDSNLPSGLLITDGKPVANDGSRTPARRAISKEIAIPLPEPVPPTADADEPRRPNVGDIVAAFVDGATSAGLANPPAPLRARVGKQARGLIAEGWDPRFLVDSARRMGPTGFNDLAVQARKDDADANGDPRASPVLDRREQAHQARTSRALQRAAAREANS